jgi:hypothetical protein
MTPDADGRLTVRTGVSALPVTIRDQRLRVVHTGLGNAGFALQAGSYIVSVALPGNQYLQRTVTVSPGHAYVVDLAADDRPVAPLSRVTPAVRDPVRLVSAAHGEVPADWTMTLQLPQPPLEFRLHGPIRIGSIDQMGHLQHMDVRLPAGGPYWVRVTTPTASVLLALPATPRAGARCLLVRDDAAEGLALAAYPSSQLAQLAAQYLLFQDAERGALLFPGETIGRLLRQRRADPFAPVVGLYLLLRGDDDEQRLRDWPARLAAAYPWLADGPAIAAEQHAARGEHRAAATYLVQAASRGIPLFTAGFSVLVARLRHYGSDGPARAALDQTQRRAVDTAGARYAAVAPYADLAAVTTTLRGLPTQSDTASELARLLRERANLGELRRRADAGDPEAANELARSLRDRGDLLDALAVLARLADAGDPEAANELARSLRDRGDLHES